MLSRSRGYSRTADKSKLLGAHIELFLLHRCFYPSDDVIEINVFPSLQEGCSHIETEISLTLTVQPRLTVSIQSDGFESLPKIHTRRYRCTHSGTVRGVTSITVDMG